MLHISRKVRVLTNYHSKNNHTITKLKMSTPQMEPQTALYIAELKSAHSAQVKRVNTMVTAIRVANRV